MGVLLGIVFIGLGVLNLVAPDAVWSLTKFGNSWEGRKSERTQAWETRRVLGGIALIVLGIVFLFAV